MFDKSNGTPLAVLDGRLITEMRTAGCTAAVARKVAPAGARSLAILGNGVQAHAHAAAFREIRQIDDFRLWGRNAAHAEAAAAEMGAVFCAAAADAVRDADMVICATSATEPILEGAWIKPGAFVASVGWNGADGREMDDAVMQNVVLVESRAAANDQAGDVRRAGAEIFAEIGEIFAGQKTVPAGETVVYDSVGVAIQDVAAAQLAYDLVKRGR